jgi:integrase
MPIPIVCRWVEIATLPGCRASVWRAGVDDGAYCHVKSRVKELVKQRGRTEAEAEELVELISGHSLRASYTTSASARNMPGYRIQSQTRHKSAQVVAGYIREADKWTKSGLDGVGF